MDRVPFLPLCGGEEGELGLVTWQRGQRARVEGQGPILLASDFRPLRRFSLKLLVIDALPREAESPCQESPQQHPRVPESKLFVREEPSRLLRRCGRRS